MYKTKFAHIILLPIIFLGTAISVYLPKQFEAIPFILFIASLLSLGIVGLFAAIRSKRFFHMFHPNPLKQIEATSNIYLNKVEKTVMIYALSVIGAIISAMIYAPILGSVIQKGLKHFA